MSLEKKTEISRVKVRCPHCGKLIESVNFVFDEDIELEDIELETGEFLHVEDAEKLQYYRIDCPHCGYHECDVDNCKICNDCVIRSLSI